MCRPEKKPTTTSTTGTKKTSLRLLLSLDSYKFDSGKLPNIQSCALTGTLILSFLVAMEMLLRVCFDSIQGMHPILENETHRHILARHIGVDALSCAICGLLGYGSLDLVQGVAAATLGRCGSAMSAAGHQNRLYTYHPAAFRLALFFFFYQVKNMYDTLVWNDGPEYIFHHAFSLITTWGVMTTGSALQYAVFFMGLSEFSTALVCLLANFDDEHGVPGLGEVLPLTKVIIGAMFVISFIVCRVAMWSTFSYYLGRDILWAFKGNDPRTTSRRGWLWWFLVSLSSLSILQAAWLGQIFVIAQEELTKTGLLA